MELIRFRLKARTTPDNGPGHQFFRSTGQGVMMRWLLEVRHVQFVDVFFVSANKIVYIVRSVLLL
jgi:hypothetical protein